MSYLGQVLKSIIKSGLPKEAMFNEIRSTEHNKAVIDKTAQLIDHMKQASPGAFETYFGRMPANTGGSAAMKNINEQMLVMSPERVDSMKFIKAEDHKDLLNKYAHLKDRSYYQGNYINKDRNGMYISPANLYKDDTILSHETHHIAQEKMPSFEKYVEDFSGKVDGGREMYFKPNSKNSVYLGNEKDWSHIYPDMIQPGDEVDAMIMAAINKETARQSMEAGTISYKVMRMLEKAPHNLGQIDELKRFYKSMLGVSALSASGVGIARTGE